MTTVSIIVGLDGSIKFVVNKGADFDSARAAITQAIEGLRLEGIDFAEVGDIERHRHEHEHTNVSITDYA